MSFVPDLRTVLREPSFGRLFAVRLTSQAADGIFQGALASYVFFDPTKQTDPGKAAMAFAILLLPYSVVGPFVGVFIDRWRRQRVLLVSNAIRAAIVPTVGTLIAFGVTGPGFYAATLAALSVNRFVLAALSASLPHVVTGDELVMGNSVSTTSGSLSFSLGLGTGLLLRTVVGTDSAGSAIVTILAAGVYLVSALIARDIAPDLLGPDFDVEHPETREALRHVMKGLADGARHVWHHRRAGLALGAITAHRFFFGLSSFAALLLYRNYFNGGRSAERGLAGFAFVGVAISLGYFVAAVITPIATRRVTEETWICWCFGTAAVVEIVLGVPYTQPAFVGAAFFLGVVAQGSKICVDTLVQRSIDDAYRGRVFSFYDILFNVSAVSAAALAAVTLPKNGKSYASLVVIAVGYAATAIVYRVVTAQRLSSATPEHAPEHPA